MKNLLSITKIYHLAKLIILLTAVYLVHRTYRSFQWGLHQSLDSIKNILKTPIGKPMEIERKEEPLDQVEIDVDKPQETTKVEQQSKPIVIKNEHRHHHFSLFETIKIAVILAIVVVIIWLLKKHHTFEKLRKKHNKRQKSPENKLAQQKQNPNDKRKTNTDPPKPNQDEKNNAAHTVNIISLELVMYPTKQVPPLIVQYDINKQRKLQAQKEKDDNTSTRDLQNKEPLKLLKETQTAKKLDKDITGPKSGNV